MPPLTPREANSLRTQLHPDWTRLPTTRKSLKRSLKFKDFYRTMSFVNALAHIANTEDHHPDLEIGYNYCDVDFSTHSIGGLSENDFICAAKIDRLLRGVSLRLSVLRKPARRPPSRARAAPAALEQGAGRRRRKPAVRSRATAGSALENSRSMRVEGAAAATFSLLRHRS